jgi:hypothetical protein
MRLFHFVAFLAIAAFALIGSAVRHVLDFAVPKHADPRAYLTLSPSPRSIRDTRRMGLA